MPIVNVEKWTAYVDANKGAYGKSCVDVARAVMAILDSERGSFDPDKLIARADKKIAAGGITGFMAGCVAAMVFEVHSRGEEFRRKWNLAYQIDEEGEKANADGGVINPALLIATVHGRGNRND